MVGRLKVGKTGSVAEIKDKAHTGTGHMAAVSLAAMVDRTEILKLIYPVWQSRPGGLFADRDSNLVARWCIYHYERHEQAPGKIIREYYEKWIVENQPSEAKQKLVSKLLSHASRVSDDMQDDAQEFYTQQIQDYFTSVQLQRLSEVVDEAAIEMRLEAAQEAVEDYEPIVLVGHNSGRRVTAIAADEERDVFSLDKAESIIKYPGELGRMFGSSLKRGEFISLLAPEKVGKTTWLIDFAVRAFWNRQKVLYFEAGDNTPDTTERLIRQRMVKRPLMPGTYSVPTKCRTVKRDGKKPALQVKSKEITFDTPLTNSSFRKRFEKLRRAKLRTKKDNFILEDSVAGQLKVSDITLKLEQLAQDDWRPDVVVIDYADLLAYSGGQARDERHKINQVWTDLRAVSSKYNCLLLTATQADAAASKNWLLDRSNFSEDKRKLAHVTGMLGLSRAGWEDQQAYRINWIVRRSAPYNTRRYVATVGCLAYSSPAVCNCSMSSSSKND